MIVTTIAMLHTIGGDDTNITAADLAAYLDSHGDRLTVVGLPSDCGRFEAGP
jgi:pyrophosphate--fructose-6-phosphate 1-phosphotransferase